MNATYRVVIQGVKQGYTKDQIVAPLAVLFRRTEADIHAMLNVSRVVVNKGNDLPTAQKYQASIEKRGCICVIEPEEVELTLIPNPLEHKQPQAEGGMPQTQGLQDLARCRGAAEGGSAEAQFDLGVRYYKGLGVVSDQDAAVTWLRKAADQGYPDAKFFLDGVRSKQKADTVRQAESETEQTEEAEVYEDLKTVKRAPSLITLNTFGFKLYGNSDYDHDNDSFMTTLYFVALFLPIVPVARYRVIQDGGTYHFLGQGKFRTIEKWHAGIFAALVAWMLFRANRN